MTTTKNIASLTMYKGRKLVTRIVGNQVIVEDYESKETWEAGHIEKITDRSKYLHKSFRLNGFTNDGYHSTNAIRRGNNERPLTATQEKVAIADEIGQKLIDKIF